MIKSAPLIPSCKNNLKFLAFHLKRPRCVAMCTYQAGFIFMYWSLPYTASFDLLKNVTTRCTDTESNSCASSYTLSFTAAVGNIRTKLGRGDWQNLALQRQIHGKETSTNIQMNVAKYTEKWKSLICNRFNKNSCCSTFINFTHSFSLSCSKGKEQVPPPTSL